MKQGTDYKITCRLASPIAFGPPMLDAVLANMARRLGRGGRPTPISRNEPIPWEFLHGVPLATFDAGSERVYCCSSPIWHSESSWMDHLSTRFDINSVMDVLSPGQASKAFTLCGPYKPRYLPVQCYAVDRVVWYVRGYRHDFMRMLREVRSIGPLRREGYGIVAGWECEESEPFWHIAPNPEGGLPVLMRPVPRTGDKCPYSGAVADHMGCKPPYWHPQRYMDVWRPAP